MQLKNFTIRQARSSDITIALQLLKTAAHRLQQQNVVQWKYWLDPPEERLQWLTQGFENSEFYFISNNSSIVAMYRLMDEDPKYWDKQSTTAYYIHSLVVHPDFKGHELGSQIINMIHKKAIVDYKKYLRLDCDATNQRLCNYYLDLGFRKVGMKQMELSNNALFERSV